MALRWHDELTDPLADEVRRLARDAADADATPALNDDALVALTRPGRHLLARADGRLVGYAQLGDDEPPTGQLVVAPTDRRRGWGNRLLTELIASAPGVHVWAFGDRPAAQALAARFDLHPVRGLLLMRRSLTEGLPEVSDPAGFRVRAFQPGADDAAFLAVNARAFAHHPEQGRLDQADLDARKAADWFDPAGFLVAEDAEGNLAGFHWTKSHDADTGEVYVLGVDPRAGGHGLGTALLHHGVAYLRDTGHREVILYVEEAEDRVVRLYRRYGFASVSRDVMYAHLPANAPQEGHGPDQQRG